ncbi:MAG: class A beta-lactamase-related serine hydrolase [Mesorhizobium sp.]|nr:class A beta-lactamase-related serine hydrolase [Mesorhizobium sp. M9A.F.Ca.ET.002.03.1.2]AZO19544.1 class A beta-lactamase-related serine hydrolase [Mesorhizobium sp. M1E.F.Ca.ET.045.02.1.1]RWB50285.1 MAG: class A beta-lactamase-related serine hydrolase [Mesorhizobium sp.]TGQ30008.1 class A beta-lactamase-related serine hydrolase [Mesorhizobium sp. M00.F.Ca.ET.216.01.1.1]RWJ38171.1 MAG: class A beta-lactamase-related serine hydrolase [Mesorhizobium sp.]
MTIMTRAPTDFDKRVDALFSEFSGPEMPGAVVAVTENGREIFAKAYGLANINYDVPMGRKTIIRIGSQSKQFAVLLILMLEAEGKLTLDDEVQKHLPYVPRLEYPVTLRHLASNTSGYRDHLDGMIVSGLSIFAPSDRQTVRDVIAKQDALNFKPGSAMIYSNAGFFMLSDIIEQIEGAPFNEVLHKRITSPLGMNDTSLVLRDGMAIKRLAAHYTKRADGWIQLGWGLEFGGEGGMVSTLNDMVVWQQNLIDAKVGKTEMYRRMATPCVFDNGANGFYGLGLVTDVYRGRRAVGHGGSVAGGNSQSMRFIDGGLGIVIIANNDQVAAFAVARRIADIYFGDAAPAPIELAPGRYRQEGGPDVFEIVAKDGVPTFLDSGGVCGFDFGHPGGAKPERGITDLVLSPRPDGKVDGIFCGTPRLYAPLGPDARAAAPLAGRYANKAQGLEVEIDGDAQRGMFRLRSDLGSMNAPIITAASDLWFLLQPGTNMRHDPHWRATLSVTADGFEINSDRVKKWRFTRA